MYCSRPSFEALSSIAVAQARVVADLATVSPGRAMLECLPLKTGSTWSAAGLFELFGPTIRQIRVRCWLARSCRYDSRARSRRQHGVDAECCRVHLGCHFCLCRLRTRLVRKSSHYVGVVPGALTALKLGAPTHQPNGVGCVSRHNRANAKRLVSVVNLHKIASGIDSGLIFISYH